MKTKVLNYLRHHALYRQTAEQVAANLHISAGRMRAHLLGEGTRYTELREQVRREKNGIARAGTPGKDVY